MQVVFPVTGRREPLLGTVGPLQLQVVGARPRAAYGVECRIDSLPWTALRGVKGNPDKVTAPVLPASGVLAAVDRDGRLVLLFEAVWLLGYTAQLNPGLEFLTVG